MLTNIVRAPVVHKPFSVGNPYEVSTSEFGQNVNCVHELALREVSSERKSEDGVTIVFVIIVEIEMFSEHAEVWAPEARDTSFRWFGC